MEYFEQLLDNINIQINAVANEIVEVSKKMEDLNKQMSELNNQKQTILALSQKVNNPY
jgi:prefoldin subunit 5